MRWALLVAMLVLLGACGETEPEATVEPTEETAVPTDPRTEPPMEDPTEPPPDPTEPPPEPTEPPAQEENCHPSYPTVCIEPPPPDLNCGDVEHRDFEVRHDVPDPDPHGFDGNEDGVACES